MGQFTGFQIDHHKAMQETIIENQIDPEMPFIKCKAHLPAYKSKALSQFQQKLLQMIQQSAFQFGL